MKTLNHNYTALSLKALIGDAEVMRKFIRDPNRIGLFFRPAKDSVKAVFKYKDSGNFYSTTLGSFPATPLSEIIEKWTKLRDQKINGENPVLKQKEESKLAELKNKYTLNYDSIKFIVPYRFKI
tara:strand:+ start:1742 stop:2113 length:372 start_codon:yes stop_codon:yes gene_type:complete